MQGGEEARSETYLDVRCNDERRILRSSAGFARASWGEARKGGVPPSEESQRRRWAFFSSLLKSAGAGVALGEKLAGGEIIIEPEREDLPGL